MDVRHKLSIWTLLRRTWKYQLIVIVTVVVATVAYREFLRDHFEVSTTVVTVLGTAIAFFIGFINSHAYERWWEARKIWGALVNDSRSFARMVLSLLTVPPSGTVEELRAVQAGLVRRHLAFLNATVARLRNLDSTDHAQHLTDEDQVALEGRKHLPNAILLLQGQAIDAAERAGFMDVFRMTQMNEMLNRFSDSLGKSERIKTTVFPAFYATMVRMSIWIFLFAFPVAITDKLGYWAILYGWLLGTIFLLTFIAGQVLMNPFENLRHDTAISTITRTIEINLLEYLDEEIPEPTKPVQGEYLL